MRKGTLNGKRGYWHYEAIAAGDAYQMRNSGRWVIVTEVTNARGPEGERFFCQVRDAAEHEIPQPMPVETEKAAWEDFFGRTDAW